MYKRYFCWKKVPYDADKIEWIEMTGKEFYCFVTDSKNAGRFFVDMGDVVLECSKTQYKNFKAEDDHSSYIREQEEGWVTIPISALGQPDGINGEDTLPDMEQNVEGEVISRLLKQDMVQEILSLPVQDRWIIEQLYLKEPKKTLRQLSTESGIPVMTLQDRKVRILTSLRETILHEKNQKIFRTKSPKVRSKKV